MLSYSGFLLIAECLLGAIFQHRIDQNANRHLRRPLFRIGFLIEFWPSLEVSVRYHFPAQAHGIQSRSYSKTYVNTDCFSYDFWVSVCLELSVWSCLFGVLTDTLDSKARFPEICVPGVCLELSVCLSACVFVGLGFLECVFVHRLGEY